jgi:hypothetical protein
MYKKWSIILLAASLILGACTDDKNGAKKATSEASQETKEKSGDNAPVDTRSEAEIASELVLKNTKLVKIFSINQRMHESYKELGPFYFFRGVDEKGRKTEVWVNKGKIYEIN